MASPGSVRFIYLTGSYLSITSIDVSSVLLVFEYLKCVEPVGYLQAPPPPAARLTPCRTNQDVV